MKDFDDIFISNIEFSKNFVSNGQTGFANRGLAIVTCIASEPNPVELTLGLLGLVSSHSPSVGTCNGSNFPP